MSELPEIPVVRAARRLVQRHSELADARRHGPASARSSELAQSFEWQEELTELAHLLSHYSDGLNTQLLMQALGNLVADDKALLVFDGKNGGRPFCPYCLRSAETGETAVAHADDCAVRVGRALWIRLGGRDAVGTQESLPPPDGVGYLTNDHELARNEAT